MFRIPIRIGLLSSLAFWIISRLRGLGLIEIDVEDGVVQVFLFVHFGLLGYVLGKRSEEFLELVIVGRLVGYGLLVLVMRLQVILSI